LNEVDVKRWFDLHLAKKRSMASMLRTTSRTLAPSSKRCVRVQKSRFFQTCKMSKSYQRQLDLFWNQTGSSRMIHKPTKGPPSLLLDILRAGTASIVFLLSVQTSLALSSGFQAVFWLDYDALV
jgi:hypothetical protein